MWGMCGVDQYTKSIKYHLPVPIIDEFELPLLESWDRQTMTPRGEQSMIGHYVVRIRMIASTPNYLYRWTEREQFPPPHAINTSSRPTSCTCRYCRPAFKQVTSGQPS